jgi:hypothetical protein
MKFMRERLIDLVASLSLRRVASVSTTKPVLVDAAADMRSIRYSPSNQDIRTSTSYIEDPDDKWLMPLKPKPLKLRKKPTRRVLG